MVNRVTNRAGFTLIELMLVVGIIGMLAGLAVPAYSDYSSKAKLTEVLVDMDDIATRAIQYQITTGTFPDQMDLILDTEKKNKVFTRFGKIEAKQNQCDSTQGMYGIKKLEGISSSVDGCKLWIIITYDADSGYQKRWDSDLPARYIAGFATSSNVNGNGNG